MMDNKNQNRLGATLMNLMMEMLSIIVAVTLGFLVNEWRQSMDDAKQVKIALSGITNEISSNRAQLADRITYYEHMVTELTPLAEKSGDKPFEGRTIEGWRGLNPPNLRGAAYEASCTTGALLHAEFKLADQVAIAYLAQEMVRKTFDWTLQSILTGQLNTYADAQRVFSLLLEASQIGKQTYDAVLESLQKSPDVPGPNSAE